jgi:hypothetical protein
MNQRVIAAVTHPAPVDSNRLLYELTVCEIDPMASNFLTMFYSKKSSQRVNRMTSLKRQHRSRSKGL